jgi:hypothetical protein
MTSFPGEILIRSTFCPQMVALFFDLLFVHVRAKNAFQFIVISVISVISVWLYDHISKMGF